MKTALSFLSSSKCTLSTYGCNDVIQCVLCLFRPCLANSFSFFSIDKQFILFHLLSIPLTCDVRFHSSLFNSSKRYKVISLITRFQVRIFDSTVILPLHSFYFYPMKNSYLSRKGFMYNLFRTIFS